VNKNERAILLVTCYGHFVSHFNMLVFPALLVPLADQFGLSIAETLSLSFWMYLLFGFSALPWGLVADKFGTKALLALFHIGAGLCAILAVFSLGNPLLFSLALTGIGLFSGIYHPVGLGWIARDVEKTSIGMAYNGMFGNLGLAAAPMLAGLVNLFFGIDAVYLMVAMINLAGVFLLMGTAQQNKSEVASQHHSKQKTARVPAHFFILLGAAMLGGIVYRGTSVTLPAYFQLSNGELFQALTLLFGGIGTENVVATVTTSMIYLLGMVGQYTGGKVGERFDLRLGYLVFHLITVPAAIAMALTTNAPLILFALIHSFFLLGMQPIENTLVSRLAPAGLMSSAYGLKFVLTFGVGALGVKVIEIIQGGFGFPAVYLSLAAVSTLLVGCIILLIVKTQSSKITEQ
jgi:MFS family permease